MSSIDISYHHHRPYHPFSPWTSDTTAQALRRSRHRSDVYQRASCAANDAVHRLFYSTSSVCQSPTGTETPPSEVPAAIPQATGKTPSTPVSGPKATPTDTSRKDSNITGSAGPGGGGQPSPPVDYSYSSSSNNTAHSISGKSATEPAADVAWALRNRQAENRLKFADLLSSDTVHEYIDATEVSTLSGVRWLDITASKKLRKDAFLSRISEGQFCSCVMTALFGTRLPSGVSANVAAGFGLPTTYVDKDWASIVLRCRKESDKSDDKLASLSNRIDRYHFQRGRYLERLAVAASEGNASGSAHGGAHPLKKGADEEEDEEEEACGDAAAEVNPSRETGPQSFVRRFLCTSRRRLQGAGNLHRSSGNQKGWRRRRTRRMASSAPDTENAQLSPLTLTNFTDRLTVFIGKELHPVSATSEMLGAAADTSPGAFRMPAASSQGGEALKNTTSENDGAASASAGDIKYVVRWRVVTVHQSSISFIQDMQTQWNELTLAGVRSRRGQDARSRARGRYSGLVSDGGEESFADLYDFGEVYGATVDRVNSWEDLVRTLFHHSTRSLQESAYRNTRRLEGMEKDIFEFKDPSVEHMRAMKRLMARLHLLSRKSTISTAILRESKMAYTKLKKVLEEPLSPADERELLYVDSVLTMTGHLEEQSDSLLFLQFSAAMGQMEERLRTLTIFSTFFIPLDFIVSCCGSNITSVQVYNESEGALYGVVALLVVTALLTYRWIRRNLQ